MTDNLELLEDAYRALLRVPAGSARIANQSVMARLRNAIAEGRGVSERETQDKFEAETNATPFCTPAESPMPYKIQSREYVLADALRRLNPHLNDEIIVHAEKIIADRVREELSRFLFEPVPQKTKRLFLLRVENAVRNVLLGVKRESSILKVDNIDPLAVLVDDIVEVRWVLSNSDSFLQGEQT